MVDTGVIITGFIGHASRAGRPAAAWPGKGLCRPPGT